MTAERQSLHSWGNPPFHAALPQMQQEHLCLPALPGCRMAQTILSAPSNTNGGFPPHPLVCLTCYFGRRQTSCFCWKTPISIIPAWYLHFHRFIHRTSSAVAIDKPRWETEKPQNPTTQTTATKHDTLARALGRSGTPGDLRVYSFLGSASLRAARPSAGAAASLGRRRPPPARDSAEQGALPLPSLGTSKPAHARSGTGARRTARSPLLPPPGGGHGRDQPPTRERRGGGSRPSVAPGEAAPAPRRPSARGGGGTCVGTLRARLSPGRNGEPQTAHIQRCARSPAPPRNGQRGHLGLGLASYGQTKHRAVPRAVKKGS